MQGMATDQRIGTVIRRARERKRWTQQELAMAVGVSRTTVDAWENDRTYPRNRVGALEEVLGVRLNGTEPHVSEDPYDILDRWVDEIVGEQEGLTRGQRKALRDEFHAAVQRQRAAGSSLPGAPSDRRSGCG